MSKKEKKAEKAEKEVKLIIPTSPADIGFGDKVIDQVNGFTGIVTVKAEFMNGCVQFCVTPKAEKKHMHAESWYIDWQRLAIIEKRAVKLPEAADDKVEDDIHGEPKEATTSVPNTPPKKRPGGPSGRGEAPPRA